MGPPPDTPPNRAQLGWIRQEGISQEWRRCAYHRQWKWGCDGGRWSLLRRTARGSGDRQAQDTAPRTVTLGRDGAMGMWTAKERDATTPGMTREAKGSVTNLPPGRRVKRTRATGNAQLNALQQLRQELGDLRVTSATRSQEQGPSGRPRWSQTGRSNSGRSAPLQRPPNNRSKVMVKERKERKGKRNEKREKEVKRKGNGGHKKGKERRKGA